MNINELNLNLTIEKKCFLCYNKIMLKSILKIPTFEKMKQDIYKPSHAYLFYGEDEVLNIEFAKVFIASIFCGKQACFNCDSCKRVEINKNPDLLIIDKPNIQVADIEGLINNVQLKPLIYDYKIVFITNASAMNETAQNKLLKTLEEPNPNVIFVLTCTNVEKLLPTIKSRLKKQYIASIDLSEVAEELKEKSINVDKFLHCGITITDAIRFSNQNDNEVLNLLQNSIKQLKNSADIPMIVSKIGLKAEQRKEYLTLFLNAIDCAITNRRGIFDLDFIEYLKQTFNIKLLIKMLNLIDDAIKMLESNVNFNYVLDRLFYNILKEKYLCK